MYALDNITVIDNFLDTPSYTLLHNIIVYNYYDFEWKKSPILPDEFFSADKMYNMQMVHDVYCKLPTHFKAPIFSKHIQVFQPLIRKLNPESKTDYFTRIKVNMTFNWGKQIFNGYHIDEIDVNKTTDRMTAIYYINTNNGHTKFKQGDVVESVANRIVIFPTHMYHSGVTATDVTARHVINLNWLDKDSEPR